MMEHALLNDESELGRSRWAVMRDVPREAWKARVEPRAVTLREADLSDTPPVKGGETFVSGPASAGLSRPLPQPCRGPEGDSEHTGGRPRVSSCSGLQGWALRCQEFSGNKSPRLVSQRSPWMVTALSLPVQELWRLAISASGHGLQPQQWGR